MCVDGNENTDPILDLEDLLMTTEPTTATLHPPDEIRQMEDDFDVSTDMLK